jgi:uncharacterized protein
MIKRRSAHGDRPNAAPPRRSQVLRIARSAIVVAGLALAMTATSQPARAQFWNNQGNNGAAPAGNIEGFTVAGKSSISAKPNMVEIDIEVSASSELTADAIVKYRDARRRLQEAFTALKLADITVEERGLQVEQKGQQQSPYFWGGMQNTRNKTEVQLTRKLIVKAANLRKLDEEALMQLVGKLLDVAQDAGAKVGKQADWREYYYYGYSSGDQGLVRFVLDDFDKVQEDAYEKAIADARSRAERLARLSHVELGPIVAVREIMVPGDRASTAEDEGQKKRLETAKYQDIPVKVELQVRFQVHSKSDNKGRTGENDKPKT